MNKTWTEVDLIREAFHYKSRFDGSIMVFKIDYPVTEYPLFPSLVKDLALLANTGFKVVIVPGAKECIDRILLKYGIVSEYTETEKTGKGSGLYGSKIRLTTAAAMPFVEMAAFNTAARFMTGFSASRVEAVIGNFVRARGLGIIGGVDMEHTGAVDKFYADSVSSALKLGMVPIIPCIGWNSSGKPYNVSSSEIALEASANLGAIKLFIISPESSLEKAQLILPKSLETDEESLALHLTPKETEAILELNRDLPKEKQTPMTELSLALRASRAGVERVHIIDGSEEGAVLKELFSNLGSGTMVYADEYESIRTIRSRDIPDILRIMEPLMREGYLVRRNTQDIQEKKEDYAVYEIDGQIHACAALHKWGGNQGEISSLAASPYSGYAGLGKRLVKYFINQAEKAGLSRVFVLTTRTHDWFESLGFKEVPAESLPEDKLKNYDKTRNSKVFALELR